ncbi:MAG: isopeptide-forming domain-containing fimbrial protein [Cyanobacteria bacterium J06626_6]
MNRSRNLLAGPLSLALLTAHLFAVLPARPAIAGPNVCATPGKDGPVNATDIVNSYFPPLSNTTLNSGDNTITINSAYTGGASVDISAGDMLMIIQMQDAQIDSSNTAAYGSGNAANDGKGVTSLGNTGIYEFVRATNSISAATGGTLTFVGGNTNDGVINTYVNTDATATRGRRTFQVIRMVQYASLTLTSNITVPDWNGNVGGVLALDIAGDMNFNSFTIDGTERGFRGGFIPNDTSSGANNNIYVAPTTSTEVGGKGEGIAGTPHYTWDGTTAIDLGSDQLPGGDGGRGAPGNAGGGGNAHNAGGGGGSNGGEGGFGGIGWQSDQMGPLFSRGIGGAVPITSPVGDRLIMGGGGGGGDVNNDTNGVRGGQGGGIVMIRADQFVGSGTIVTNGSDGEEGEAFGAPDGAGGGGAGGTVALIAKSGNLSGLTVVARGGNGGDTTDDLNNEHGPGGGGGGGVVISTSPGGQVPAANIDVAGGDSGLAADGAGSAHGSTDGVVGIVGTLNPAIVPPVQQGADCFPLLTVVKTEANPGTPGGRTAPGTADYTITVTNSGAGGAANVQIADTLPAGFTYASGATATLGGGATGPASPTNSGTASAPSFGSYIIPEGGSVAITFSVDIVHSTPDGTYENPAFVSYLDPSATTAGRLITPATGASGGNTTYEAGSLVGTDVPGASYVPASSTGEDVVIVSPGLVLVKRITAVNGQPTNPNDGTNLAAIVDDINTNYDNQANWPNNYLVGELNAGVGQPGDELEYTVYFLNKGGVPLTDVRLCDRIFPHQILVTDAYGSGADVELQLGTSTPMGLTVANDSSDRTQLIPAGSAVPATCNLQSTNDNGTLQIDITGAPSTGNPALTELPHTTGQATPNDAYGLFRFTTRVGTIP